MDNRRVKFCLKILSRFGKIIKKPQGVKFFGAPCSFIASLREKKSRKTATRPRRLYFLQLVVRLVQQMLNKST